LLRSTYTSFHCKIYIELSKKHSIESKVDSKPPFAMLLMTPYMAKIKIFPNFY
jgi:hypothetical protein